MTGPPIQNRGSGFFAGSAIIFDPARSEHACCDISRGLGSSTTENNFGRGDGLLLPFLSEEALRWLGELPNEDQRPLRVLAWWKRPLPSLGDDGKDGPVLVVGGLRALDDPVLDLINRAQSSWSRVQHHTGLTLQ